MLYFFVKYFFSLNAKCYIHNEIVRIGKISDSSNLTVIIAYFLPAVSL